ncbi:DUF1275 domain-containing protein [Phragmitibacter flavus]|uniref:DUF1275 domain-containing protein n=1 Tax=Phragmitibacter flavus TaxID=2576071 RepID=A0A5R8KKB4_9BACT|nr:YoaK family protein [Phragmitibacter flavus]TLD72764.1 DUF1275 domain-containing protein [Phragmitibacter flavus]
MITKLPGWVWMGAALLATIGGMVNAVGFLGLTHEALTHLTGTTTSGAIALVTGDWRLLGHMGAILTAYFSGSVLSGFIIQQSTLRLGRRYGVTLLIESLLLLLATPLLMKDLRWGEYLATCACGVQNAMATSYSGAVIRTTHMSGIITDLGIWIGHWLRGLPQDHKRAWLGLTLFGGFFLGGVLGAVLFARFSYATLLLPAVLTGVTGLVYTVYQHWRGTRPGD